MRKFLNVGTLVFILIVALIAFGISRFDGFIPPRDLSKNVVTFHLSSQPDGLHPYNNNSGNRTIIFNYTQKTLLKVDLKTLDYLPSLVKELPEISDDLLYYTYQLREDVYWDNGEPFTARDVAFSTKLQVCPLTDNAAIRSIYSTKIADVILYEDDPYKFTMVAVDTNMFNPIIYDAIYMQQASHWDPEGILENYSIPDFRNPGWEPGVDLINWMNEFNNADNSYIPERLVGLGPYKVTEWVTNSYITLERKENWWGEEDPSPYNSNYPEKIIFKIISDGAATKMAVKNQNLDVTIQLGTSSLLKLRRLDYFMENYHNEFIDEFAYAYIGMNMRPESVNRKPFFVDQRVRRAMAHLVPVDEIIEVLLYGHGKRQVSNVSPLKDTYNTQLNPIPFDIEKAKELLEEAGWVDTDGNNIRDKMINGEKVQFSFELNYFGTSQFSKEMSLMCKEEMYKAGIEVRTNPLDFTLLYKQAYEHDFDAMFGVWGGNATPSDPTQLWHTQSWINKGSNFFGFGDAESDSLIELSNRLIDSERRREVMWKLQEKIYEEQPYIFLYSRVRPTLIHKRFDNAEMYSEKPGLIANHLKLKPEFGGSMLKPTDM